MASVISINTHANLHFASNLPEHDVLACCLRTAIDDATASRLASLLSGSLDWEYLIHAADFHGVLPQVHQVLSSRFLESLPHSALDELSVRARKQTVSNLLMASEMRSVIDLLGSNQIDAVPVKGPTLAISAYADIGLRQFGDIDILIRRRDVVRARDLLASSGYKPTLDLAPSQHELLSKLECECGFRRAMYIELVWEVVLPSYSFSMNDDELWRRLSRIEMEGVAVPVLSDEDTLLLLAVHGTKHAWRRLVWISDFARAVESSATDWTYALERARRLGGLRMLLVASRLAEALCGIDLPETVRRLIESDPAIEKLKALVERGLSRQVSIDREVSEDFRFYLRSRERLTDRARGLTRLLLTPTVNDLAAARLPDWLSFLYWPLHPLRLAAKYGSTLLRRRFTPQY
jgi:hypothetical protein